MQIFHFPLWKETGNSKKQNFIGTQTHLYFTCYLWLFSCTMVTEMSSCYYILKNYTICQDNYQQRPLCSSLLSCLNSLKHAGESLPNSAIQQVTWLSQKNLQFHCYHSTADALHMVSLSMQFQLPMVSNSLAYQTEIKSW